MNSVTHFTKALSPFVADRAFADVWPDFTHTIRVPPSRYLDLIAFDPFEAGKSLHDRLPLLGNNDPLSDSDRAYFPFLGSLRDYLRTVGVKEITPEQPLAAVGPIGFSKCDLKVFGGLAPKGVIEVKTGRERPQPSRGTHLAQLGLYARMIAGWGDYDQVWAALAYVDLHRQTIDFRCFSTARKLIFRAMDLWEEAA
jgi:hypothetical protein